MQFQETRSVILRWLIILSASLFLQGGSHPAGAQSKTAPPVPPGSSALAGQAGSIHIELPHQDNLNELSLKGSILETHEPLVVETDPYPQFTRQMIEVKWRNGDPIYLYVIRPKGIEKPPVVLYLYSYPSETDRFRDEGYCQRVTSGGFAAVGFVSALTGQRYHDRPMKEWFVSELRESLVDSVHDVQMILNYLNARGDVDMTRVGMFGAGSGGTIAILAASVDPRIRAIDLLDPWGDWPQWMAHSAVIPDEERPRYVTSAFQREIAFTDPVRVLPSLVARGVRVRIQQEDDEADTPLACQKAIDSAAGKSAEIVRVSNSMALFARVSGGRLFDWIKEQLKPAAQTKSPGGKTT